MTGHPLSAVSFRDPGGFVYEDDGCILRQVNFLAREHYDQLMRSGLYRELTEKRLLIAHDEVDALPRVSATAYRVIRPEPVSLISYPFEWSFSQYKDAALLTLAVERHALRRGMALKDCSAYNVQFHEGGRSSSIRFRWNSITKDSHGWRTGNFASIFWRLWH